MSSKEGTYQLKGFCESKGILLKLYGIDYFANELFEKHKYLIKQHLGISIATEQILTKEDFIQGYNKAKTSAPLNTNFKFRCNEIEAILKRLDICNVVLLCGSAGVGKTRLAIECCERFKEKSGYTFLCIRNNNQPIYDDLYLFFRPHNNYIVLIDDANELSHLDTIFRFLNEQTDIKYKIILTVRNYAAEDVVTLLKAYIDIETQRIAALKDEEIRELLKEELNIKNDIFLDRIVSVSEGNARIAFLAGKISVDTNSLNSITNVTDIYSSYYKKFFNEIDLKERKLFISAAVAAFIGTVRIDHLNEFTSVISVGNIGLEEFTNYLYDLYRYEIIDIFKNTAVRFEDQCLANYYVFIEKKWLRLSEIIKSAFVINQKATISAINVLFNLFVTKENQEYLSSEIKSLWDEFSNGDQALFWEYIKVFHLINPTDTLMQIKQKIDAAKSISINIEEIKINNNITISDDIIEILSGFENNDNLETALDLYFRYFKKRPDLIDQFYSAAVNCYGINKECFEYNFYTPKKFIEKMMQYSDNWQNKYVNKLFVNVSSAFLKLHFDGFYNVRNDKVNIFSFDLINIQDVKDYRFMIWNGLIELYSKNIETSKIEEILSNYGCSYNENASNVMRDDYEFIFKLLSLFKNKESYCFAKIYSSLDHQFKRAGIKSTAEFNEFQNLSSVIIYTIFDKPHLKEWNLEKSYELQKNNIKKYLSDLKKENFYGIIDFFCDADADIGCFHHKAFEYAFEFSPYYEDAIEYYFHKHCDHSLLDPCIQIQLMFKRYSDVEIWNKLSILSDDCRNTWLYNYFQFLPEKYIDFQHLCAWYDFLKEDSDKNIKSSGFRGLTFLKKFKDIDQNVIITSCQIIFRKQQYSKFMVKIYFELFFSIIPEHMSETIAIFEGNYELLSQIYFFLLSCDPQLNYDGIWLKELYKRNSIILDSIFDQQGDNLIYFIHNNTSYLNKLFEIDDYECVFDHIMEKLIKTSEKYLLFCDGDLLSNKTLADQYAERPDKWIKHFISKYYNDEIKMQSVFTLISNLQYDQRTEYINVFIQKNKNFEVFKNLPLFPSITSWSGSEVPLIQRQIDFLNCLLPSLTGLDYLEHKNYIANKIEGLKKCMKEAEINELIRGF